MLTHTKTRIAGQRNLSPSIKIWRHTSPAPRTTVKTRYWRRYANHQQCLCVSLDAGVLASKSQSTAVSIAISVSSSDGVSAFMSSSGCIFGVAFLCDDFDLVVMEVFCSDRKNAEIVLTCWAVGCSDLKSLQHIFGLCRSPLTITEPQDNPERSFESRNRS